MYLVPYEHLKMDHLKFCMDNTLVKYSFIFICTNIQLNMEKKFQIIQQYVRELFASVI
jgi:hypothetical protein